MLQRILWGTMASALACSILMTAASSLLSFLLAPWLGVTHAGQVERLARVPGAFAQGQCRPFPYPAPPAPLPPPTVHTAGYPIGLTVNERTGHVFVLVAGIDPESGCQMQPRGSIVMLDGRTARQLHAVPVGVYPARGAVDERTNRLFVLDTKGSEEGRVTVLDAGTGALVTRTSGQRCPCSLVVSERTGRVFQSFRSGIRMLDATTGRVLGTSTAARGALVVDESHRRVIASRGPGDIRLLDAVTGKRLGIWDLASCGGELAIDQRLGRLFTGSRGAILDRYNPPVNPAGHLCLVDTRSGKMVRRRSGGHGVSVELLAVDEPASVLILYGQGVMSGGIAVVDARDGRVIKDGRDPRTSLPGDPRVRPVVDTRTGRIVTVSRQSAVQSIVNVVDPRTWSNRSLAPALPVIPYAIAVDHGTRHVFVASAGSKTVTALCLDAVC